MALAGTGLSLGAAAYWVSTSKRSAARLLRTFIADARRQILAAPSKPTPDQWSDNQITLAWIGHATVLINFYGIRILTDPAFGNRIGVSLGLGTAGPKRYIAPALRLRDLPPIDVLLLSHAHMDHMDLPSLRHLENRKTAVVMASKTSDLIRVDRYGNVRELGWGERAVVKSVEVRAFEVNHWGARMRTDTYRGYNGYVMEAGRYRILFAGDTANTTAFRSVRSSRAIDLAVMPVGAYNPWIYYHCTPEQAWRMGNEAGVEQFIPVHHRTFQLSREPLSEPLERFLGAAGNHDDRVAILRIGQEFHV